MTMHKVILQNSPEYYSAGMSTEYKYENGKLIVRWKRGEKSYEGYHEGDYIFIKCFGGFPEIGKIKYPHTRDGKLEWLMGFSKYTRHDNEDFDMQDESISKIRNQVSYERNKSWTEEEKFNLYDSSYSYEYFQKEGVFKIIRRDHNKNYGIWISPTISNDDIIYMLIYQPGVVLYDMDFTKQFLLSQFGIEAADKQLGHICGVYCGPLFSC